MYSPALFYTVLESQSTFFALRIDSSLDFKTDGFPIGGLCFWFSNDTEGFLWYARCLDNTIRFAYCLPACIIHPVSASPISPSGAFLQRRFNICVTWKSSRQFGRIWYSAAFGFRRFLWTRVYTHACLSQNALLLWETLVCWWWLQRDGVLTKRFCLGGHSGLWPVYIFHHRKGFTYTGCC